MEHMFEQNDFFQEQYGCNGACTDGCRGCTGACSGGCKNGCTGCKGTCVSWLRG